MNQTTETLAGRRLLVAERDRTIREFVCDQLRADGFEVADAGSERGTRMRLSSGEVGLVVVGALERAQAPVDLVSRLRRGQLEGCQLDQGLPVIAVTTTHDELAELRLLRAGCDDYVALKGGYPALRARIDALVRRAYEARAGRRTVIGELVIDRAERRVSLGERALELSAKEFALLCHLAQEPTRVYTKRELLREVWGYQLEGSTRTLDSHASRLRRKLAPSPTRWIVNVWGVGYRLTDSVGQERRAA